MSIYTKHPKVTLTFQGNVEKYQRTQIEYVIFLFFGNGCWDVISLNHWQNIVQWSPTKWTTSTIDADKT